MAAREVVEGEGEGVEVGEGLEEAPDPAEVQVGAAMRAALAGTKFWLLCKVQGSFKYL